MSMYEAEAVPWTSKVESRNVLSSTSRLPEIRRSFEALIDESVAVFVPNLEYETVAPDPTCNILVEIRYEDDEVPWTSNVVDGDLVNMPTLLVLAST